MTDSLISIANYLFGWVAITVVLSFLLAAAYPLFSRTLVAVKASQAAFFTLLYGLLAAVAAMVALILLLLPSLTFPFISDHCHGDDCTPHKMYMAMNTMEGVVMVGVAVTALAAVGTLMVVQVFSSRRRLLALNFLSKAGSKAYRIVDSPEHIAWCAGLLKPQVYLSSGLVNALTPQQVQIIVAHELTHSLRRDNLRKWALHWATLTWPQNIKRRIRQDLSNYCEQACDLAAAQIDQEGLGVDAVIDTLNTCYSINKPSSISKSSADKQQRLCDLSLQLDLQRSPKNILLRPYLLPAFAIITAWFTSVILAIHFGHPLLEWLAQ